MSARVPTASALPLQKRTYSGLAESRARIISCSVRAGVCATGLVAPVGSNPHRRYSAMVA
jgi:hypothetical protein